MTEFFDHLDQLKQRGREFAAKVRPRHLAMLAGAAFIGVGVLAVSAMARPGPETVRGGERLQIQVVAPVEPDITPGPVMEVGHLVDGPVSIPAAQPEGKPVHDADHEDPVEPRKPSSGAKRSVEEAVIQAPPQPEAPAGGRRDSGPDRRAREDRAREDRDGEQRDGRRRQDDGPPPGYRD